MLSANLPKLSKSRPMVKETEKKPRKSASIVGSGAPGPGRPKGSQNKTTTLLKDAILQAAKKAGGDEGLVGYLEAQAKANPGPFLSLLGKVLPMQLTGDDGAPIAHVHEVINRIVDPKQG